MTWCGGGYRRSPTSCHRCPTNAALPSAANHIRMCTHPVCAHVTTSAAELLYFRDPQTIQQPSCPLRLVVWACSRAPRHRHRSYHPLHRGLLQPMPLPTAMATVASPLSPMPPTAPPSAPPPPPRLGRTAGGCASGQPESWRPPLMARCSDVPVTADPIPQSSWRCSPPPMCRLLLAPGTMQ